MATKSLTRIALARPSTLLASPRPFPCARAILLPQTVRTYATPSGPPPSNFRLPPPERWDESKESSIDKAGKFFLMSEMFRGMYVVLEQYFRPPYVATLLHLSLRNDESWADTLRRYTIYYPFEKVCAALQGSGN